MDYRNAKKLNPNEKVKRKNDGMNLTIQEVIPWKTLHQKKVIILKCIDEENKEINLTHLDII